MLVDWWHSPARLAPHAGRRRGRLPGAGGITVLCACQSRAHGWCRGPDRAARRGEHLHDRASRAPLVLETVTAARGGAHLMRRKILRRAVAEDGREGFPRSLHPVLCRAYRARGINAAADLDHSLDRLLPVGTLGGVEAAVDLLLACHPAHGKVLVIGDFDADGATSTAVVVRQLE